jgi:endothelin-converting enzyme/putative endopeptidase
MRAFLRASLLGTGLAFAVSGLAAQSADQSAKDKPLEAVPYTPSLDVGAMDRSVDPCEDLYTYSCGGWQKSHPLPPDQSSWSVYSKVTDDNQRYLWGVLDQLSRPDATHTLTQRKLGDYFAACMDTAAVESAGHRPLDPYLERIAALKSKQEIPALLGDMHRELGAGGMFFISATQQDARDATKQIAAIFAAGLGLPDRDYYVKSDAKSKETRRRYQAHVEQMFVLSGATAGDATKDAATVMHIETALAKASLTQVEQRNPYNVYHRESVEELEKSTPAFAWSEYFTHFGAAPQPWLNVSEPKFTRELNALLQHESLPALKAYLRWGTIDASAPYLSKAWVDENFNFYSAYLRGVEKQRPRWKRCVGLADRDLGDALGKEFVERTFPPAVKAQTVRMTEQIERAMRERIEQLDWMSPETKKEALTKLTKMRNKVGYPDMWRDYSALDIRRNDFFGNLARAVEFETKRQSAKIGKPVDENEWGMTAPTVNAYYDSHLNDVNFPAGVLLPPLYDPKIDDAPNYGDTGGTIGHELTHGFDDEGRQFDGDGNLRDWWTKKDAEEFEQRAQCVRNQYSTYTIVDDVKINGKLTSGEDIADFGGLIIAWMAWQEQTRSMKLEERDGLTPEQRFFVGFAQWSCENTRPEQERVNAVVDPHSPSKYRINGVVVNMPEFAKAFQCKAGQALVKKPENVCRIW